MADEETRTRGLRLQRWTQLRGSLERNEIHVLGLQEHHCRTHEDMDSNSRRLRGLKWDYIGNTSTTLKSGVMVLWQKHRWTLQNSYSSCPRTIIASFHDEDAREWTMISAHFHHDPAPRKKQWAKMVAALELSLIHI